MEPNIYFQDFKKRKYGTLLDSWDKISSSLLAKRMPGKILQKKGVLDKNCESYICRLLI